MISQARIIAHSAHDGQFRRDGKTPYITHPTAVAAKLEGESQEIIATAWLHDVLEDTKVSVISLREQGIPSSVIEAVQVLTKTDQDYEAYLLRVKANPIARKVKIADMLHNLSETPSEHQIVKYAHGLLVLHANL